MPKLRLINYARRCQLTAQLQLSHRLGTGPLIFHEALIDTAVPPSHILHQQRALRQEPYAARDNTGVNVDAGVKGGKRGKSVKNAELGKQTSTAENRQRCTKKESGPHNLP